jgi:hypothetical protein
VKGAHGALDARLDTLLAACRSALLEGRAQHAAGAGGEERP